MTRKQKNVLTRIILSTILISVAILLPTQGMWRFVTFVIPYVVIGYDILIKAIKGILRGQPFDENFLMAIATVGAMILGEYVEGVAVMLFYQIGELFQSCAVGKSRKNISELMDISPDYANIETENGNIIEVDPYEVDIGSVIVVKVGEKVPIDGVIIEGSTTLDTSALTGESLPREAFVGSEIISGCINKNRVIKVRTTKKFEDSTVSKILDLIENAGTKKSRPENFISKFAKYYTPLVCIGALTLAIIPPIVSSVLLENANWGIWVYRALTFLVISCPCALVISIPLSFFSGIGGASNEGILIKGSNYLEVLSKIRCVVFDKTGTLTNGAFKVSAVCDNTIEKEKLIEYAALAEMYSIHPISKSIKEACSKPLDASRVSDIEEISGFGVSAKIDGNSVAVGNSKLMKSLFIENYTEEKQGTVVYVAINGNFVGKIIISDELKLTSKEAIKDLKSIGIKKTVMLTGDVDAVARDVSSALEMDEVYSELLPADKVQMVENLIKSFPANEKLAFVGDGINDAPVLARADIGIAMGAFGSDSAIEAADVVLMDDDPMKLVKAIKIARKCLRVVYQNIYFAIGVKLICLLLGALGIANMWFAIFADVGVMVIAVLNAVRVLNVKKL